MDEMHTCNAKNTGAKVMRIFGYVLAIMVVGVSTYTALHYTETQLAHVAKETQESSVKW